MSEGVLHILVGASFALVVISPPIIHAAKTGRFLQSVFLGWGLMVVWFLYTGILGAMYGSPANIDLDQWVSPFPETISVAPALVTGWIFSGFFAALGLILRKLWGLFGSKYLKSFAGSDSQSAER